MHRATGLPFTTGRPRVIPLGSTALLTIGQAENVMACRAEVENRMGSGFCEYFSGSLVVTPAHVARCLSRERKA